MTKNERAELREIDTVALNTEIKVKSALDLIKSTFSPAIDRVKLQISLEHALSAQRRLRKRLQILYSNQLN